MSRTRKRRRPSRKRVLTMKPDIWHDPLFLAALKKGGAGGTASGDIVSFYTPKAAPLRALTVGIDPVQDLHGYDSPWPAGGGKNKLVPEVPGGSITWNDVTLSVQNGELYLNGKPTTSGGRTSLRTSSFTLPAGTYIISCITTQFVLHDTSDNIIANTLGTASFTLTENTSVYAGFNVIANTQYSGVLKAQIESGTTATPYSPYSNLCPISGWDGAQVWRTGRNLYDLSKQILGTNNAYLAVTLKPNTDYVFSTDTTITGLYVHYSDAETQPPVTDGSSSWTNITYIYNNTALSFNSGSHKWYRLMTYEVGGVQNRTYQLELGSTPTAYTPYTGTTIPVTFAEAGTVYGGVWDVVNGALRVTHAEVDLGTRTWTNGTFSGVTGWYANAPAGIKPTTNSVAMSAMASDFTVIRFNAISTKVGLIALRANGLLYVNYPESPTGQLVYELATPLTYTLTPAQLDTLVGTNVVWGDTGAVDLEYAGGGVSKDMMLAAILSEARR